MKKIFSAFEIATVCHEANRQLTRLIGDVPVQPAWDEEDPSIRNSCVRGVEFNLANPDAPPSASHDNWLKQKIEDGWTLGPVKDIEKKTHPAMVPYGDLPDAVKRKDALFKNIVSALR